MTAASHRSQDREPQSIAAAAHPPPGRRHQADYELALSDDQAFVAIEPEWLFRIAASVLQREHIETAEVSFALVDDAVIRRINRRYLNHDTATDVLSFPLHEGGGEQRVRTGRIEAEIIISGETATRVASELGRPPDEEVALYAVHGLLHLCGFDDRTESDRAQMHERQQWHLKNFGIEPHY